MILNELAQVAPEKQVAKIFEQYFGKDRSGQFRRRRGHFTQRTRPRDRMHG